MVAGRRKLDQESVPPISRTAGSQSLALPMRTAHQRSGTAVAPKRSPFGNATETRTAAGLLGTWCGMVAAHLEDGDEVCVHVVSGPLVEALPALDDDKRREHVAIRRLAVAGRVVLDGKSSRHHRLQLRLGVQLPLPLKPFPVQVELDRRLHVSVPVGMFPGHLGIAAGRNPTALLLAEPG